jgi:hypothetical protein
MAKPPEGRVVTAHLLAVYVMVWVVGHVMGCGSFFDIVLKSFTPTGAEDVPPTFNELCAS